MDVGVLTPHHGAVNATTLVIWKVCVLVRMAAVSTRIWAYVILHHLLETLRVKLLHESVLRIQSRRNKCGCQSESHCEQLWEQHLRRLRRRGQRWCWWLRDKLVDAKNANQRTYRAVKVEQADVADFYSHDCDSFPSPRKRFRRPRR